MNTRTARTESGPPTPSTPLASARATIPPIEIPIRSTSRPSNPPRSNTPIACRAATSTDHAHGYVTHAKSSPRPLVSPHNRLDSPHAGTPGECQPSRTTTGLASRTGLPRALRIASSALPTVNANPGL